ncbi:MAG: hypothetical protein MRY83_03560 [Flavobacteriales bacterium]|nr:hypothetical protein [Flavobacteriales bacterium]
MRKYLLTIFIGILLVSCSKNQKNPDKLWAHQELQSRLPSHKALNSKIQRALKNLAINLDQHFMGGFGTVDDEFEDYLIIAESFSNELKTAFSSHGIKNYYFEFDQDPMGKAANTLRVWDHKVSNNTDKIDMGTITWGASKDSNFVEIHQRFPFQQDQLKVIFQFWSADSL